MPIKTLGLPIADTPAGLITGDGIWDIYADVLHGASTNPGSMQLPKQTEAQAQAVLLTVPTSRGGAIVLAGSVQSAAATGAISAASWAAGVATYTVPSTANMTTGETRSVVGITPSGYNVTGTVTVIDGTTFSMAVTANPGAYVSGGVAFAYPLQNFAQGTTAVTLRRLQRIRGQGGDASSQIASTMISGTVAGDGLIQSGGFHGGLENLAIVNLDPTGYGVAIHSHADWQLDWLAVFGAGGGLLVDGNGVDGLSVRTCRFSNNAGGPGIYMRQNPTTGLVPNATGWEDCRADSNAFASLLFDSGTATVLTANGAGHLFDQCSFMQPNVSGVALIDLRGAIAMLFDALQMEATANNGEALIKIRGGAGVGTVTAATWAAGVATYTVPSTANMANGQTWTVGGITPSGWNVTGVVTVVDGVTFSIPIAANPGAWVSGGIALTTGTPNGYGGRIAQAVSYLNPTIRRVGTDNFATFDIDSIDGFVLQNPRFFGAASTTNRPFVKLGANVRGAYIWIPPQTGVSGGLPTLANQVVNGSPIGANQIWLWDTVTSQMVNVG